MNIKFFILLIILCVGNSATVFSQVTKVDEARVIEATVPAHRENETWWRQRHQAKKSLKDTMDSVDLVFIGDSITHSWESKGKAIWDEYFAKRNALNLGFSGDRTEHVIWRLRHEAIKGISPKVVVVMIGTNNTGQRTPMEKPADTAAGISKIIAEIRQAMPKTKILLLAIFPRDPKPRSLKRQNIDSINEIISKLDDGKHVFYLDINQHFLSDDGSLTREVMPDFLHPNAKGYQIWAEAMEPKLEQLLNGK